MSVLEYNTVTLDYCRTETFDKEPIYADAERTQYWYTRIRLGVVAIIHPSLLPAADVAFVVANNIDTTSPATIIKGIRRLLWQPRKQLTYTDDSQRVLDSPVQGATVDAKNGPIPLNVRIRRVSLGNYEILFEIETYIVESEQDRPALYASHRFSDTVRIEADFRTVKTRRGTVRLWSDGKVTDPEQVKSLIIPRVPNDHQRLNLVWAVAEDGLTVHYEFTDRQLIRLPPKGAVSAQGKIKEVVDVGAKMSGFFMIGVTLSLVGPPDGNKKRLIATALRVAWLQLKSLAGRRAFVTASCDVEEDLYNNSCTVVITAKVAFLSGRLEALPIEQTFLGEIVPEGTQKNPPPDPGTNGTLGVTSRQPGFIDHEKKTPGAPPPA